MNGYYLASAILLFLLAVAHTIWGHRNLELRDMGSARRRLTTASLLISWYQGAAALVIAGLVLLWSSLTPEGPAKLIGWIALGMLGANLLIFLAIVFLKFRWLFRHTAPQMVYLAVVMGLIALGMGR